MQDFPERHLAVQHGQQAPDLGGHLGGFLGGPDGCKNRLQHEGNESRALAVRRALPDGLVVLALAGADEALDGYVREQGFPAGQDQRLPEPAQAPVAVLEGMNELELVVEDRARHERMVAGVAEPRQQVGHEPRHLSGGRADVMDPALPHHGHAAATIAARRIQQRGHQDLVGVEKIGLAGGVPLFVSIVGADGVPGLLNVPQRGDDRLAVENRRDLLLAEDVALDGQRPLDRADAVDAPQTQVLREAGRLRATHRFGDLRDPGQ